MNSKPAPAVASESLPDEPDRQLRVALSIAYDGSGFNGWARQPGLPTVQGHLEQALEVLLRVPTALTVAGRTDAGVHATGQVAHFDVPGSAWQALASRAGHRPESALLHRLGALLGRDDYGAGAIVVRQARAVPTEFDARFSALRRHYEYVIACDPARFNPLERHRQWWVRHALDAARMQDAAGLLLGEHDFGAFCKPREGASTVRTLERLEVFAPGDAPSPLVCLRVSADAFCHSMVRSLVGALVEVGRGRRDQDWLAACLSSARRVSEVPLAPARGLTLVGVDYPPLTAEALAAQSRLTRRFRG